MWTVITHKAVLNAAKHSRLFLFPVSHLVTELPPSQRWSWEEAPSRLLVSRKALNSGQQSTPCNIHNTYFQLKLETYKPLQGYSTCVCIVLLYEQFGSLIDTLFQACYVCVINAIYSSHLKRCLIEKKAADLLEFAVRVLSWQGFLLLTCMNSNRGAGCCGLSI